MPGHFIIAMKALRDFLKNPIKDILVIPTMKEKRNVFISLFFLEILIAFCISIIITILFKLKLIPSENHEIVRLFNSGPVWFFFIVTIVISPIIEELLFRLHLRLNEKLLCINLIIILSGTIFILMSILKLKFFQIPVLALVVILLSVYYFNRAKFNQFILSVWNGHYVYVFYITACCFGIMHITNYNLKLVAYLFLPLLILPQLVLGLFCGYIRLRLGFTWGYIFHSFHNFIFIIPMLITALLPVSDNYSISIVEQNSSNIINTWRMKNDTIEFDRCKIKEILPRLTGVDEEYIEYEDPEIANKILKINFAREAKKPLRKTRSSGYCVLTEILRKYNLKIEQKPVESEFYQLRIVDSVKLFLYKQERNDTPATGTIPVFYKKIIILNNVDLHTIAHTIAFNYNKNVVDSSRSRNKYTIRIPELGFEELNQFMTDQYGIKLNKGMSKVCGLKVCSNH